MYLGNYINDIKEKIKDMNLTENELVMYVYIDLAKRFKFNPDFFFANMKTRKSIYNNSFNHEVLNDCMESNTIICRSAAKILEYVLTNLGVKIITVDDPTDCRSFKHVFNIIIPKDKSPSYVVDLQEDISNIHFHGSTKSFGVSFVDDKLYIVSREEQKRIHKKIGYIDDQHPYTDDYINLFKLYLDDSMTLIDKLDLVLDNIEPYYTPNINYWERRWKHEKMLLELFGDELKNKLNTVEFYQDIDGEIIYNNGFFINTKDGVFVYYYNNDEYKYDKYPLNIFAKKVIDEKIHYRQGIMGIRHHLNEINSKCKM